MFANLKTSSLPARQSAHQEFASIYNKNEASERERETKSNGGRLWLWFHIHSSATTTIRDFPSNFRNWKGNERRNCQWQREFTFVVSSSNAPPSTVIILLLKLLCRLNWNQREKLTRWNKKKKSCLDGVDESSLSLTTSLNHRRKERKKNAQTLSFQSGRRFCRSILDTNHIFHVLSLFCIHRATAAHNADIVFIRSVCRCQQQSKPTTTSCRVCISICWNNYTIGLMPDLTCTLSLSRTHRRMRRQSDNSQL